MFELYAQRAIFEALKNSEPLAELITGVYDDAPQAIDSGAAAAFPYITVGDANVVEHDTDTSTGARLSCVVHAWDRSRGREKLKEIQGQIYNVLHRAKITVYCYDLVDIHFLTSDSFLDSDGKTRHGTQTFELIVVKTPKPQLTEV